MYLLERVHLVQFFLFQSETLELDLTTAIIAPNGAGKSALLDALQIVMLGGDRNLIRFNAQAGGSHRARSIRDYCLGVYRAGEDGHTRNTATTYISLVFRDEASGQTLTAGIALGAAVNEPDHRLHGRYLLPGVALSLEDHLELGNGHEMPLDWPGFRERILRRCKDVDSKLELHPTSDRFIKDLLVRLRPGPTSFLDPAAYRKAFQNALNLQRVDDVDLFVRTQVAEDRPTEITRFRALLDGFRMIKEKIEQVARRIADAEVVEIQYRKVASQATRAASWRALAAEYERDLHSEKIDAAEQALKTAQDNHRQQKRALQQARSDRETTRREYDSAHQRQQNTRGYSEQASFAESAGRDRADMVQLKKDLMRQAGYVRDQLQAAGRIGLPTIDAHMLAAVIAPWQTLYQQLATLAGDADINVVPETIHAQMRQAVERAAPVLAAVTGYAREQQNALEMARQQAATARRNQSRLNDGKAELRPEVTRLMNMLQDDGISAQPICDLVKVVDPGWQPAIEAYLGRHVEALLIPAEHEERAVRMYRSLQGGRAVYGVKLAMTSQARRTRGDSVPADGSVSTLLSGENADALAYLRRQLGELRCVETEAELIRSGQGLSRDGVVTKGGGIERLRLSAISELKIGASDNRERQKQLRAEMESAERDVRRLEAQYETIDASVSGLARIGSANEVAQAVHDLVLKHREAEGRYRALKDRQAAITDPDLVRLSEQVRDLLQRSAMLEDQVEKLIRQEQTATDALCATDIALQSLRSAEESIAKRAAEAFAHPDVDANRVEQQRLELEAKHAELSDRLERCHARAAESDKQLSGMLPAAWSGLTQYAKDHGLMLVMDAADWRLAEALLQKELGYLKGTELVQYQAEADQAYVTAVETFRSNVASALYDNFTRLKQQINTLNRTLKHSPAFSNNERYQFHYEIASGFKELHRFIHRAAEVGADDNLFGSAGEVPEAFRDIIEDKVGGKNDGRPSPLDDYRRFFNFEVHIKQGDRVIGTLSERMRSGSGGEHRAPLYVIAGAALAAAYGKTETEQGGLGVIMLDEFGDKIDAQNARATTNYLRSLGLQLILAAPDTAQGTLTGVLDSYVELFRDGDLLQLERVQVTREGRELLQSDQFLLHPDLLEQEIARIQQQKIPT